jgi:hypothetical protein
MKKENMKKASTKKLTRVTKSNLKDFIGGYKNILPIGVVAFFLSLFVGINLQVTTKLDELPQTGEPATGVTVETFATNVQNFLTSPEGAIFLVFFIFVLLISIFYVVQSSSLRNN